MRDKRIPSLRMVTLASGILGLLLLGWSPAALAQSASAGAGYTTFDASQGGCLDSPNGIDCNNYRNKNDVYVNGGPTGGGGLSNRSYYFAVLVPGFQNGGFNDGANGNLSDTTPSNGGRGSGDLMANRTFVVTDGLITSYGGTHNTGTSPNGKFSIQLAPYDDTPNRGGVYILAVCQVGATSPSQCKFDAFRVKRGQPIIGQVEGLKYYDANLNGRWDAGELGLPNWPIDYTDGVAGTVYTGSTGSFSNSLTGPDTFHFAERQAAFPWVQTGNTVNQTTSTGSNFAQLNSDKSYDVTIVDSSTVSALNFGNVCVVPTGGRTLGFWSNQNGQALIDSADLAALAALHLRNADGSDFDPGSKEAYGDWLLAANAQNMAYMLSAQLSALVLDVRHGFVDGNALILGGGGRTVNQIIVDADALLAADGLTFDGDPNRAAQETIKTLIDAINNNNQIAVPPTPSGCPWPPVFP